MGSFLSLSSMCFQPTPPFSSQHSRLPFPLSPSHSPKHRHCHHHKSTRSSSSSRETVAYEMVPDLSLSGGGSGNDTLRGLPPPPVLSLSTYGSSSSSSSNMPPSAPYYLHQSPPCASASGGFLPPWFASAPRPHPAAVETGAPSVDLSLHPSEQQQRPPEIVSNRYFGLQQTAVLSQLCRELEEGRQKWLQHKKEANWRLSRLEKQLETEKTRRMREKVEQIKAEIRRLRDEESSSVEQIESECRDQLTAILRDADAKEAKMIEAWVAKHARLTRLLDQLGGAPNCFQINKDLL